MKRSERFLQALSGAPGVSVVTHNFPDPDAIASGWGLKFLVEDRLEVSCRVQAGGIVMRAENLKMVELLAPPLELVEDFGAERDDAIVLVDCQPPGGNHLLSGVSFQAAAVVDHHPPSRERYVCGYRDVRPSMASCATMVAEYLREQDIRPGPELATALFLGMSADVARRPVLTPADQRAARFLARDVDFNLFITINNAPYPRIVYRRFSDALQIACMVGDTVVCHATEVESPAGMAGLADLLIRCEEVNAVLVTAPIGGHCFLSVRSTRPNHHAGDMAAALTEGLGSGGGHEQRAAGRVPLHGDSSLESVQSELYRRWIERLGLSGAPPVPFLNLP